MSKAICNLGDIHEIRRPAPHPKGQHRHGCYSVCPEMTDEELIKSYGDCGHHGDDHQKDVGDL